MIKKHLFIIALALLGVTTLSYAEGPGNSPDPMLGNSPNTLPQESGMEQNNLIPPLVQQEVQKIKALKEQNDKEGMPSLMGTTTGQLQNRKSASTTEEQKQIRQQRRYEQIKNFSIRVADRFKALITREEQIRDRIQSRIAKLEEDGFDMTDTKAVLVETEGKMMSIKTSIEALRSDIVTSLELSDSESAVEDLFAKVKEETKILKEEIKAVHVSLVQTVKTAREEIASKNQNKTDGTDDDDEENEN